MITFSGIGGIEASFSGFLFDTEDLSNAVPDISSSKIREWQKDWPIMLVPDHGSPLMVLDHDTGKIIWTAQNEEFSSNKAWPVEFVTLFDAMNGTKKENRIPWIKFCLAELMSNQRFRFKYDTHREGSLQYKLMAVMGDIFQTAARTSCGAVVTAETLGGMMDDLAETDQELFGKGIESAAVVNNLWSDYDAEIQYLSIVSRLGPNIILDDLPFFPYIKGEIIHIGSAITAYDIRKRKDYPKDTNEVSDRRKSESVMIWGWKNIFESNELEN